MSQGEPIPFFDAISAANELVERLRPACERIEIAGSLRRRKPAVGDIELVVIPRFADAPAGDLWGELTERVDLLARAVNDALIAGSLAPRAVEIHRADGTIETGYRMGSAYRALVFDGIPVDLFATDADRWGCIFALRTGPGDWNTRLVTDVNRHFRQVQDGRVLHFGKPLPTPEERDFFRAMGQRWLEPEDRDVRRVRIDPTIFPALEP